MYENCQVGLGLGLGRGMGVGVSCLHPLSPLIQPAMTTHKNKDKGWLNDSDKSSGKNMDTDSGKEGGGGTLQKGNPINPALSIHHINLPSQPTLMHTSHPLFFNFIIYIHHNFPIISTTHILSHTHTHTHRWLWERRRGYVW